MAEREKELPRLVGAEQTLQTLLTCSASGLNRLALGLWEAGDAGAGVDNGLGLGLDRHAHAGEARGVIAIGVAGQSAGGAVILVLVHAHLEFRVV